MKCSKCVTEMDLGIAIKYDEHPFGVASHARLNKDTLELVDVLKCPKCGHSVEIENLFAGDEIGSTGALGRMELPRSKLG
jgi:hypothetical protein